MSGVSSVSPVHQRLHIRHRCCADAPSDVRTVRARPPRPCIAPRAHWHRRERQCGESPIRRSTFSRALVDLAPTVGSRSWTFDGEADNRALSNARTCGVHSSVIPGRVSSDTTLAVRTFCGCSSVCYVEEMTSPSRGALSWSSMSLCSF